MDQDKISVVFCSRKTSEENKSFVEHLTKSCGCDTSIFMIHNSNGVSLTKIYQDMMESSDVTTDIIVFIHDDIEFLKKGWGEEIVRLFTENEDYGIIGVAGSAQFDQAGAWWNYPKKFGQVLHRNEGKSWLTAFSPLLDKDLQEVAVIDGLFMAVNKKRATMPFDRELEGFNFYDIDFCLSNLVNKTCKIGVTTNIRLAHNSIGEVKKEWMDNREIINKKYCRYYPIDVLA